MKEKEVKLLANDNYVKDSLEYQLVEYVNNDPLFIVENPVNIISKKLHINTSTLTRLIRNLGYKNYKIFRNCVIEKIVKHKKHLLNKNEFQNTNNLFEYSIISNMLTIKETIESNNTDEFDEIINEIINAKNIFLFGIGFTFFICQYFAKYLGFSQINCYNVLNFYDALQFTNASAGNLWIILSITLKTKEIIFLLEELISQNNNKIIVITANYTNPILNEVNYVLKLKSNEYIKNEIFNLNLKVALTALINLIILKVINKTNSKKR